MADEKNPEVEYVPSTAQRDLEARVEAEKNGENPYALAKNTVNPGAPEEHGNHYLGTDPVYQNHANDTEAPLAAQEGVFKEVEESYLKTLNKTPEDDRTTSPTLEESEHTKAVRYDSVVNVEDPGTGEVPDDEEEEEETGSRNPSSPTPPSPSSPASLS